MARACWFWNAFLMFSDNFSSFCIYSALAFESSCHLADAISTSSDVADCHSLWEWNKIGSSAWCACVDCLQELIRLCEKNQAEEKRKHTVKIVFNWLFNGAHLVSTVQTVVMDIARITWRSICSICNNLVEVVDWTLLWGPRNLWSLLNQRCVVMKCCVPLLEQDMTLERSLWRNGCTSRSSILDLCTRSYSCLFPCRGGGGSCFHGLGLQHVAFLVLDFRDCFWWQHVGYLDLN